MPAPAVAETPRFDVHSRNNKTGELEAVLSRYLPSFHRQALRYLGNSADAEDAVQDALLLAYTHLGQFRAQARLSTWLMAIVINSARTQLRRQLRETYVSLDERSGEQKGYPLQERLPDRGLSAEEAFSRSEDAEHLKQLSQQLSAPLRRAFLLRDLDGLSIREMKAALRAPEGTVKARIVRARTKIRSLMEAANRNKALGTGARAQSVRTHRLEEGRQ